MSSARTSCAAVRRQIKERVDLAEYVRLRSELRRLVSDDERAYGTQRQINALTIAFDVVAVVVLQHKATLCRQKYKTRLDPHVIRAETCDSFFSTHSFQGDRYACHNSRGFQALNSLACRCPELAHGESGPGRQNPWPPGAGVFCCPLLQWPGFRFER